MNHYGVYVNPEEPTTGVLTGNQIDNWPYDWIDLGYVDMRNDHGDIDGYNPDCEHCQEWERYCLDMYEPNGMESHLWGDWKLDDDGLYEPDKTGEYAAIYNPNENTVQVVWSRYTTTAAMCSPCYPGQADIGTPGRQPAYTLPPDMMQGRE